MKTLIFAAIIGLSLNAAAQDENRGDRNRDYHNVPDQVNSSFRHDHPGAQNEQWEHNGRHWHANYHDQQYSNRNVDAYYDKRGRMVDQHIAWERSQLPQDFDEHVYGRYHTHDYNVVRIERPNASPLFQLSLNLGGSPSVFYTDEHGNRVRYKDRH